MGSQTPSRVAIAACLAATTVVAAQVPARSGRALAIEDYYRVSTITDPRISPNGAWVVYSLATRVEDDNSTRTQVYIVPSDGSAPPRIVGHSATSPTWTDDSWLEYTVGRERWRLDASNADATPVKGKQRPAGAVSSADGRWIAFTRDKSPVTKDRAEAGEFERRHDERFKGVIFDWKDFQRDGAPFPAPSRHMRPAAQLVVQPSSGGERRVLVDLDLRPGELAWHPNSRLLAFTADATWRDELRYEAADLWTVSIDGQMTRLTESTFVHSDVSFSPDGKYLAYAREFGTDMVIQQKLNHGGPRDLFVRPVAGGEPMVLTAKWDLEPGPARWSPDSRFLYFTAAVGGESHLFRVSVPAGEVEQVTKGARRIGALTFDAKLSRIAYTVGAHETLPELYVASIDGGGERRLTNVHARLTSEIAFSKAERLRWPSHDRTEIDGWLMFPHGYDGANGRYPLIVTSHGGPHAAVGYDFSFKKQLFAANGYFVLDTNFRGSTGYGEAFKWATWGEWGQKDGEDVISGVEYVLTRYPIDRRRVGHIGHSYGGFMTNWLIARYPDTFAAAVSGAGISNWISDYGTADIYRTKETEFFGTPWDAEARDRMIKQSPLTYAGAVKTPTLFVHGEVDQRVPYEEAEQMYFALKRRGVTAKMIQYASQAHGISGHWNNVHRMIHELKWFDTYLKSPRSKTN